MRKLFKILFAVFVILMVLFIASAAVITYDVAGALATDVHPLPKWRSNWSGNSGL